MNDFFYFFGLVALGSYFTGRILAGLTHAPRWLREL